MSEKSEIIYIAVSADAVMGQYAEGFKSKKGEKIFSREWFYDPQKGVVVFRLGVKSAPKKGNVR